ncbi:MAG: hypothetical protein ACHQAY_22115 [Hyphomicrobiales bacterium]
MTQYVRPQCGILSSTRVTEFMHSVLVNDEIKAGRDLVAALDEDGFDVKAAMWLHSLEHDEWKLIIASATATKDLHSAYMQIARILNKNMTIKEHLDLSKIKLVPPDDPIISVVGRAVKAPGLHEIRFEQNAINGVLVGDMMIYRMAA